MMCLRCIFNAGYYSKSKIYRKYSSSWRVEVTSLFTIFSCKCSDRSITLSSNFKAWLKTTTVLIPGTQKKDLEFTCFKCLNQESRSIEPESSSQICLAGADLTIFKTSFCDFLALGGFGCFGLNCSINRSSASLRMLQPINSCLECCSLICLTH